MSGRSVTDVWNELADRDEATLSPTERIVCQAGMFLFDLDMGGWLYNFAPDHREPIGGGRMRDAADALAAIGSPAAARALRNIADIMDPEFHRPSKLGELGGEAWGTVLARADPGGRVRELEAIINAESDGVDGPGLWERLESFTLANFECTPG